MRPFRLDTVAARLAELIGRPMTKVNDTVGPEAQAACAELEPGGIIVLENVRFNKGEKKGDAEFARLWRGSPTVMSMMPSAPATATRPRWWQFPSSFRRSDGPSDFWSRRRCTILETLLKTPKAPYIAVMGGAKVSDKIGVIENLLGEGGQAADRRRDDLHVHEGAGQSHRQEQGRGRQAGRRHAALELAGEKLVLPVDHLVATSPDAGAETKVAPGPGIPDGWFGMDIGPATIALYASTHQGRRHSDLERTDGQVRGGSVRAGTRAIAEAMASSPP